MQYTKQFKNFSYNYVPWQPSGFSDDKLWNPGLHKLHCLPMVLFLQKHCPGSLKKHYLFILCNYSINNFTHSKELMSPHATVAQWGPVLALVNFNEGGNPKQVEIDWNSESSRIQWWMEVWLTDSPEKKAHGFWSNGHLSYPVLDLPIVQCSTVHLYL